MMMMVFLSSMLICSLMCIMVIVGGIYHLYSYS
jgi:hypothetical protein